MPDYFSRPVVCNTGPLIGLARAGLCHLPSGIFPSVLIPGAVVAELHAVKSGDAEELSKAISTARILQNEQPLDPLLLAELDIGEASVIQTARAHGITGVLIDERKARRIAHTIFGLEVRGTCALLLEAKRRQLIPAVHPPLAAMIAGGYFIGPRLVAECLTRAGE
jgi:predicted nucleic acid-binding protein